jgi:hypothetical protein
MLVNELTIFGVKVELWMFMAAGMLIAVIVGLYEYRRAVRSSGINSAPDDDCR